MAKTKKLHTTSDRQEIPNRFLLRQGDVFYRLADLQVVAEPGDKLSVYLKPPIEYLYQSLKPNNKIALPSVGMLNVNLNNDVTKGVPCFNPYLSWHGSGRVHANAYSTRTLEREKVLKDSPAVAISDITTSPDIILTAIFPVNTLSHAKTVPPPPNFGGNYVEISNSPYAPNVTNKDTTAHCVLDIASLRSGNIVMDIMIHNRVSEVDIEKNHPYPNNAEMYFVAPAMKIMPSNTLSPAVSVFLYQPINDELALVQKQPTTMWARSTGASEDIFIQYELL